MQVVFWQNMPSHIQAPVLREFADIWPQETHAVWCGNISETRRQLGWNRPCFGKMAETTLPACNYEPAVRDILAQRSQAIHIFSGLNAYTPIQMAFEIAKSKRLEHLGLMVEPGVQMGLKGVLRPWRARWIARRYRKTTRLVLAMGSMGVRFYQAAGFAEGSVFPFMYQSAMPAEVSRDQTSDPIRLIYVGKFNRRKGLDILLQALAYCNNFNWQLTIVGAGREAPQLKQLANKLHVARKLNWAGVVPSDNIHALLAQHDLCLVPSRFDGWGAVTNEAISAGIAVICSDQTGSKDLVVASKAGAVFRSGKPISLARKINHFLDSSENIVAGKRLAKHYRKRIEPKLIAQYLADVVKHRFIQPRIPPQPPWVVR